MTADASFRVDVSQEDAIAFATLSGDWNPLHTNAEHAAESVYRRPVLHGAFSAGLMSRMAGMHLPGASCLLHSLRLRFIKPIVPPATLTVDGTVVSDDGHAGRVDVTISDAVTGVRYVEGGYEFGRHEVGVDRAQGTRRQTASDPANDSVVLVTGATGALGRAVLEHVGAAAVGLSRSGQPIGVSDLDAIRQTVGDRRVSAIVHCAWPSPDNQRLTSLANISGAVEYNVAAPLRQMIALAQFLSERGTNDAVLVLVGSSASNPGRHNYRMPLYTLSKSLVSPICRVLAVELGATGKRCVALTFDVIDGGMNSGLSAATRAMHMDRVPSGTLPSLADAATQIGWVLDNRSSLASGGTIDLTGSAIP